MSDVQMFYDELLAKLKASSGTERTKWAEAIATQGIDLKPLLPLLSAERSIAMRFSWMLSDIGLLDASLLHSVLHDLFVIREETNVPKFPQQFAKYWRIAGIPEQDEGLAIDMLFHWLADPHADTHIKTVSLDVLDRLMVTYPELKNELSLILEEQPDELPVSLKAKIKQVCAKL